MRVRTTIVILLILAVLAGAALPALAAPPDGTLAIGVHVTLVSRWLDPGDTEALITPFMVLYLLHDALVSRCRAGS
jgi:peptide/nickel transport system substrate-binding protein